MDERTNTNVGFFNSDVFKICFSLGNTFVHCILYTVYTGSLLQLIVCLVNIIS